MSKQAMREEAERLIRESMEKRSLVIKQTAEFHASMGSVLP